MSESLARGGDPLSLSVLAMMALFTMILASREASRVMLRVSYLARHQEPRDQDKEKRARYSASKEEPRKTDGAV